MTLFRLYQLLFLYIIKYICTENPKLFRSIYTLMLYNMHEKFGAGFHVLHTNSIENDIENAAAIIWYIRDCVGISNIAWESNI